MLHSTPSICFDKRMFLTFLCYPTMGEPFRVAVDIQHKLGFFIAIHGKY